MRVRDIASLFDMAATTVVTIRKDKDKIIASAKNATPLSDETPACYNERHGEAVVFVGG